MEPIKPEQFIKTIIGMTKTEAKTKIEYNGYQFRIRKEDGQQFVGTTDMRMNRVNLSIVNGIVTEAYLG